MAIHYYDEKDIKPGSKISGKVVVNHKVEQSLTPEEIEKARKEAKNRLIESEMERLRKNVNLERKIVNKMLNLVYLISYEAKN